MILASTGGLLSGVVVFSITVSEALLNI